MLTAFYECYKNIYTLKKLILVLQYDNVVNYVTTKQTLSILNR